jgi:hypothetical protein
MFDLKQKSLQLIRMIGFDMDGESLQFFPEQEKILRKKS